jgi:ribose 5-phosphate isomerase A
MDVNQLKKKAAEKAVEEIKDGMIVGLGTGSTFQFALEKLAQRIASGELKNIIGVPSSIRTEKEAHRLGVPVSSLNEKFIIDITIDGADEVDENLNLIKGGGGALLREKILAQASNMLIIVVDESKLSKHLGTNFSVPVEVIQYALNVEKNYLESLGAKILQRKNPDGSNFITDENNFILDANFGAIKNLDKLTALLNQRAGIVEHGIFIGMTSEVISASNKDIKILKCK